MIDLQIFFGIYLVLNQKKILDHSSQSLMKRNWVYLFFCPDSGHSVFRSDWAEDAMSLHFHARMDQYLLGHVHIDINHFSLFANGKQWISDSGYHTTNNDHHSTVLIDGLGQSGTTMKQAWPTLPGKLVVIKELLLMLSEMLALLIHIIERGEIKQSRG